MVRDGHVEVFDRYEDGVEFAYTWGKYTSMSPQKKSAQFILYGIYMKEFGDMRVSRLWISIVAVGLVLCGCGKKESNSNFNMTIENETDVSEVETIEKTAESVFASAVEESGESMEKSNERVAELYETIQNMIDETDTEFFKKPDYFGVTLYTEDKFEEIKQYEMNIVLDYLGIKHWNRPPYSRDEAEFSTEDDAPLGEYTIEKLKEYTNEEHDLTVEYFCGGSILKNLNNRYIALIIKEHKNGNVENLYYKIIDYGYLGVMTGSNSIYYKHYGSLEDIDIDKIEQGDMGDYVTLWLDEDAGEVNLIYDIGKEKRTNEYGSYTSYAQSIWVILKEEETGYMVKEIIPMRLK